MSCACLGIEPIRPGRVPHSRLSVRHALHGDRAWHVQAEVERIELRYGASQRMSNLWGVTAFSPISQNELKKSELTTTTDVAPFVLIRFLTWVRMAGAVALCASLNPPWTKTPPGTPGNRLELSGTWAMFKSSRIDKLAHGQSSSFPHSRPNVQLRWVRALVGDDHRVLLRPITDENFIKKSRE